MEWALVFDVAWLVEEVVTGTGGSARSPLTKFEATIVGRAIAPYVRDAVERAAQDAG